MERQRIIIPSPDGELVTSLSPTLINDGDTAKFENAERVLGKTRKRPGTSELITEITDSVEPRGIYNFKQSDGTENILVYERGLTTSLTKKIYTAVAGTWLWDFLNKDWATQGDDLVLTSPTVPRFETFRDYCFISQGDTVIGLMYWSGSGNVKRVIDEGNAEYGVSGRFINIWKERLVISNGYYYALTGSNGSAWSTSRISSGVFFSSLTYSDGTIVHPYQSKGWWEIVDTYKEIAPKDGSEIVAQWIGKNRIFIGKETGIWAIFGDDPAHIVIDPVTDIGMQTDHSLQEYANGWKFKNKDGWHTFDGVNQPQLIDESIRNLVMQVPNFDIGGNADMMQIEIDSGTEWTTAQDGDATSNITIPNGNIELTSSAISPSPYSYTQQDNAVTCGYDSTITKYGFKFVPSPASTLTTVKIKMKCEFPSPTGTFDVSIFGDDEGQTGFPVVEMTTAITTDISDLSGTATDETFDFTSQSVNLLNNRHYWVVISWADTITNWFFVYYKAGDHSGWQTYTFGRYINGQWDYTANKRGYIIQDGTNYAETGDYETLNTGAGSLNFDQVPTVWGIFNVSDLYNQEGNIVYRMRTSTDQSTWTPANFTTDASIVTPGTEPLESNIPVKKYVDLKIDLTSFSGRLKTPKVYSVRINAAIDSGETTDRLMCSTIFNDRYLCATNNNKDGEFRTFVLDKERKWGIYPDQIVRGYVDIDKEKYLMTLNDNMELYKMYPGKTVEEYFYDWSVYKNTSSKFYYFDIETKKTDCGYPGVLKLFHDLWITVGSIMGTKYVQGIVKYKIDDEDWVAQNFEDTADSGDISVIRLIFPAESRGYAIQFAYETYKDSADSPTDYGQPYNLQNAILTFHTQPELKSIVETQTDDLDTGYLIEE